MHSCGSVPPHSYRSCTSRPGYFDVGIKSYGRAPTFLMATGYEQVRSVAAYLAGDLKAADTVQLVLPETGVCSVDFGGGSQGQGRQAAAAGLRRTMRPVVASPTSTPRRRGREVAAVRASRPWKHPGSTQGEGKLLRLTVPA